MFDWLFDIFKSGEEAWEDAVRRFVATAQGLDEAEYAHLALRPYAEQTGDIEEWDALQDRILYTRQAVTDLRDKLAATSQWFRQTFGLSALSAVPLIPIAIITASISAMVTIIYAVNAFNQSVRAKWEYINTHQLSPAQATDLLNSGGAGPGDVIAEVGKSAVWLVAGGFVLLALPGILKKMKD